MSERDEYGPGVPCWVDTWQSDAPATAAFYADLLGWDTELTTPDAAGAQYVMCRLRGRDVAAIGSDDGPALATRAGAGMPRPQSASMPARPAASATGTARRSQRAA